MWLPCACVYTPLRDLQCFPFLCGWELDYSSSMFSINPQLLFTHNTVFRESFTCKATSFFFFFSTVYLKIRVYYLRLLGSLLKQTEAFLLDLLYSCCDRHLGWKPFNTLLPSTDGWVAIAGRTCRLCKFLAVPVWSGSSWTRKARPRQDLSLSARSTWKPSDTCGSWTLLEANCNPCKSANLLPITKRIKWWSLVVS